jgi:lipopolysaccharide export system protein LptA
MALTHQNKRRRTSLWALAALSLLWLEPLHAADRNEPLHFDADQATGNMSETLTLVSPQVREGSTVLKALSGVATGLDGGLKNSTWVLTGDVHLEFDGAVLEAQAATAVFVNGLLSSVEVSAASAPQKKPVHVEFRTAVLDVDAAAVALSDGRIRTIQARGTPAQFSYEMKKSARRYHGRAGRIDYDAARSVIKFSVDTWYTDGNLEAETSALTYNFSDDSMITEAIKGTYPGAERVPAPRTPDRATAK